MKLHLELGIIVVMSAMMVFAMTAYVMPSVYAAESDSSRIPGESGDNGAETGWQGMTARVVLVEKKTILVGVPTTGGSTTGNGRQSSAKEFSVIIYR